MRENINSITADILNQARTDCRIRQEALKNLEELDRLLNDPGIVQNKDMALSICNALIQRSIECKAVVEGSIMHRLGLRLLDYINREGRT
jgi:hypothetical protein